MNNICAPNINIKEHYTCFEFDELKSIAKAFNDYILKNKRCPKLGRIKAKDDKNCILDQIIDINNKTKRELWNSIYKRLEPICKYEYCWLDLDFVSKIKDISLREKILYLHLNLK